MNNFYVQQLLWSVPVALVALLFLWTSILASRLVLPEVELSRQDFFGRFCVGAFLYLIAIQIWNLWLPLSGFAYLSITTVAVAIAIKYLIQRRNFRFASKPSSILIGIVFASLLLLRMVLDSLSLQGQVDGYHYTLVRWLQQYALPPGLANLDLTLGWNNTNLLFAAFLSSSPIGETTLPTFNMGLVAALGLASGEQFVRSLRSPSENGRLSQVYLVYCILPVLLIALTIRGAFAPSSLSSDIAVMLIMVYSVRPMILLFESDDERERLDSLVVFLICAGLATSIKLSSAPFFVTMTLGSFVLPSVRGLLLKGVSTRPLVTGLLLVFLVIWLIRGVILSGYVLFPYSGLQVPVDWLVPRPLVNEINAVISDYGSSRFDGFIQSIAKLPWSAPLIIEYLIPLLLACGGLLVWLISGHRRRLMQEGDALILTSSIVALAFWALAAPDPRFALGLFWIIAFVMVGRLSGSALKRGTLAIFFSLSLLAAFVDRIATEYELGRPMKLVLRELIWRTPPGPTGIFSFPVPSLQSIQTCGGLQVFRADLAWNAPLLTSQNPTISECLTLREKDRLEKGFRIVQNCTC